MTRSALPLCLAAGLLAGAAAAVNMLPNGDFEAATPNQRPEGWEFTTWGRLGPAEGGVSKRAAHTGKRGLWLASELGPVDFAVYSPPLDVNGRSDLFVSFYYRTRQAPSASVAFATFGPEFVNRRWDAPIIQYESRPMPLSKEWRLATWRIRPCPKASLLVLLFHVSRSGLLYVDDARLTPWPDRLTCEAVLPGVVSRLPGTRLIRARLTNRTDRDIAGRAILTVAPVGAKPLRKEARFSVPARDNRLFDIEYSVRGDRPHSAELAFAAPDRCDVYDALELRSDPPFELHVVRPAFRQTVLATIPFDGLVARLRANTTEELAAKFSPSAWLASDVAGEPEVPCQVARESSPTTWRITSDKADLAHGHYTLLAALNGLQGKPLSVSADLWVRKRRRWEVGYDEHGRLLISGKPMFPLGILDVYKSEELSRLREARFTFIVVPHSAANSEMLQQAYAMGLRTAVAVPYLDPARWASVQARLRDDPGLLGWFAPPEPDRLRLAAAAPSALRAALSQGDPYHPVLALFGLRDGPLRYADAGDVLLVGAAAVPYWGLETLTENLDVAMKAATGKPVWAVIQTHGKSYTGTRTRDRLTSGRPPSPAEQRCLTYLALTCGARGILYSAYSIAPTSQTHSFLLREDAPELWNSVVRTNQELTVLAPYFLTPQGPEPLNVGDGPLRGAIFRHGKRALVIIVNPALHEASAEVRLPVTPVGPMKRLFGGEAEVGLSGDTLGGFFPPLAVAVCELTLP